MKHPTKQHGPWIYAGTAIFLLGTSLIYWQGNDSHAQSAESASQTQHLGKTGDNVLHMSAEQTKTLSVGPVVSQKFVNTQEAVGVIDFNQDKTVSVFSPYQGRIGQVLVKAGDTVQAGQTLYTVNIPDMAQAASTLISSAGVLRSSNETLRRAKDLAGLGSIAQKELDQNTADQQTAEANYRAARKSLRLFGLSDADIEQVESSKKIDTEMPVRSPLAGRITARAAVPGQVVQPGAAPAPAPITVSDMRALWMVASVPESELASYRLGQSVAVSVPAYPGKTYSGKINYISDTVDPNTHRLILRADVQDPAHELRQQMLATFRIDVGTPVNALAVPLTAVVREGDGTSVVWVTQDGQQFLRRSVQTGATQSGMVQVLSGLHSGETIARENVLFLSNLYLTDVR